jgi:hypothetical protein
MLTAHTATHSINVFNKVFEDILLSHRLCGLQGHFYLCGNLQDKVYWNYFHTLDELKQIIHDTIISVEVNKLNAMSNNLFTKHEICLVSTVMIVF